MSSWPDWLLYLLIGATATIAFVISYHLAKALDR